MSRKSTLRIECLPDGALIYIPDFLVPAQASSYFDQLRQSLAWEQSEIRLYGKSHKIPRLNAWYGEPGIHYRYSGTDFTAIPWTAELASIRDRLVDEYDLTLNSVLANYYRDGQDAMGWHADNEPELGAAPVIATVSLGAKRTLRLRHNRREQASFGVDLAPGSLLIMGPSLQGAWQHSLPRRVNTGPRVSLTFRQVVHSRTS
ncbi:alpha-ketoglutarate-dependent dioxygenase AlkB [Simiduia curdlanivorans]|uniref:Alpha-ketoglutarate-dependent dioxygenase AlkB family protein n=1 Tax=Simiduia curdlanivorans TaxID=1492769 RepID=A0ABV8VBF7_9GAMM|nr:alpha-ketoglutarate-dependent dioxygenase AlkB [Simiduia curdlanivorans]MDN3639625.1 alpha-ketoglutarate-dependent dioxygenase AlkB [Simiduia curdlanivorans]